MLIRPQDLFPVLNAARPAWIMTVVVAILFCFRGLPISYFKIRQIQYYYALVFAMMASIPFSYYSRLSLDIFTQYTLVLLFSFVFYAVVNSITKLLVTLSVGCLGVGLYSFFAITTGDYLSTKRLAFSGMFDPNDLAYFALSFMPFNLLFISREHPFWLRLAAISSLGTSIFLIFLTGSRGGMIAFVVAVFLLFFKTSVVRLSLKILFVLICGVLIFSSNVNQERYLSIFSLQEDYNTFDETGRIAIWTIGLKAMINRPLTGVGLGCFAEAVGKDREARGADTIRWQSAHNSAIQIGAETGILGFVLFLWMSFNVLRIFNGAKNRAIDQRVKKIAEVALVGFTGLFVSGFFLSQAYSIYWAFYVTLSAMLYQFVQQEE